MNPFEIFGLMAIGGAIVFVLLTAILRLESRLMKGVVEGDRTPESADRRGARHRGAVVPIEVDVVANEIVSMNERIRTLHASVRGRAALDHLAPLVRHADLAAASALPFATGDSHRVGRSAAEYAAARRRLLDARQVLRVVVEVLAQAAQADAAPH